MFHVKHHQDSGERRSFATECFTWNICHGVSKQYHVSGIPRNRHLWVANRPVPHFPSLILPLERWKTGESSDRLGGNERPVQRLPQSRLRPALLAPLAIQRNPLRRIPQVCGSELRLPPTPVHVAKPLEMQLVSFELLEESSSASGRYTAMASPGNPGARSNVENWALGVPHQRCCKERLGEQNLQKINRRLNRR